MIREKTERLRRRAADVKADPKLRHVPTDRDLRKASENASDMAYLQYQTLKTEKNKAGE